MEIHGPGDSALVTFHAAAAPTLRLPVPPTPGLAADTGWGRRSAFRRVRPDGTVSGSGAA